MDKDGRYYKPVGTETGQISSGKTIFGRGGNQQNWPHDLLRFFIFDEGYVGYSIDLSQIENRIVAHVGGVVSQIDAFRRGIDPHRLTASVIFGKPYDQISGEDGSSTLGDGKDKELKMLKMMSVFLAGKIFKSAIETGNPYFLAMASFVLFIVFLTDAYDKKIRR